MGLGGLSFVKQLLGTLFVNSVVTDIESVRKETHVVVEDMSIVINNIAPYAYSIQHLKQEIRKHIPRTYKKFPKCTHFVSLIDDSGKTPKAKKPTQKNREARAHLEEHHIKILGDFIYPSKHGHSQEAETSLLERAFEKDLKVENDKRKKQGKSKMSAFTMYINRALRTRKLKGDMSHMFTRELLLTPASEFVWEGGEREYVVDGAVWANSEETTIRNNRFAYTDEEAFEGESDLDTKMVNQYDPKKCFEYGTCTISTNETGKPKLWDHDTRPGIGEADVKIVSWLRFMTPLMDEVKENDPEKKKRNLWVSCSDTDLIIILLLWVRELIDPITKEFKHNLYLDCTSRKKSKTAEKLLEKEEQAIHKKYKHLDHSWNPIVEVYDICKLWTTINKLFLTCFPGISNPVEVFCLLIICAGTDFVVKPPHLGMGALWNAFCVGGYSFLSRALMVPAEGTTDIHVETLIRNEKRPMGYSEKHIIEFYRFAYYVLVVGKRKELGILDNSDFSQKEVLEGIEARLKALRSAKMEITKREKSLKRIQTRFSFHQNLLDVVQSDAVWMSMGKKRKRSDEENDLEDQLQEERMAIIQDKKAIDIAKTTIDTIKRELLTVEEQIKISGDRWKEKLKDYDKYRWEGKEDLLSKMHMPRTRKRIKTLDFEQENIQCIYNIKRDLLVERKKGKPPRACDMVPPHDDHKLRACARTIIWNMDYWIRSAILGLSYKDISLAKHSDGDDLPIFGWSQEEQWDKTAVVYTEDVSSSIMEQ